MPIAPRDARWKVAAAVSHEAQRAFDSELKRACDDDIEAALNETVERMRDNIEKMPYQLARYKPMDMKPEDFARQLEDALHNWFRPIIRALGK
jgi:hypothetical protein